jgi:t-SNARE complex subunit (syntaxin)
VEGTEARISQREKDIKLIAKSINDLAEIFKDLSALVIDQV